MVSAVFFDIGGVVVYSPLVAIHRYEVQLGLPKDYLNVQITGRGNQGSWQRFERGEIQDIRDFYADFGRELSDTKIGNNLYIKFLEKQGLDTNVPLPSDITVGGRELFGRMVRESTSYDPRVIEAIRRIRESNQFRIIALTNNFLASYKRLVAFPSTSAFSPASEIEFLGWQNGAVPQSLQDLFDDFIDSSEVGMRKPEPEFFEYACRRAGLAPPECIMLDDLGMNLKSARQVGMRTIHVAIKQSWKAIRQLEIELGIPLLAENDQIDPSTVATARL